MSGERSQIVLGIVCNHAGDKVLVARRLAGTHLGGLWEFPGGKVRSDETAFQALKRELLEEINIDIRDCSPLISFDYDYPDRLLRFSVWKVHNWAGELTGKEGQETRWLDISSLEAQDFPAANKGIIVACKLPPVYLITPDLDDYTPAFVNELSEYITAGVRLVQFRSRKSEPKNHKRVIKEAIEICHGLGAELIVNATPEFAMEIGADGVHLSGERLLQSARRPLPAGYRVAASCHNVYELNHAVNTGVDFCVLSQVRKKGPASSSGRKRDQTSFFAENILGWDGFSEMVSQIPLPVYALGGVRLADLNRAREQGAQGVALISDVWNRPDSAVRLAQAFVWKSGQGLSVGGVEHLEPAGVGHA